MFEKRVRGGEALSRADRRELRRAYHGSRASRSSGLRILLLVIVAVAAVMLLAQSVLAVGGDTGERIAGEIIGRSA